MCIQHGIVDQKVMALNKEYICSKLVKCLLTSEDFEMSNDTNWRLSLEDPFPQLEAILQLYIIYNVSEYILISKHLTDHWWH